MARPRLPLPGVRRACALPGSVRVLGLALAASGAMACDGDIVNLGNTAPLMTGGDSGVAGSSVGGTVAQGGVGTAAEWIRIDEPVLTDQEEKYALANPALPLSMEYMLFTRQLRGAPDPHIWKANRGADGGFRKPDFANENALPLGEDTDNGASNPA